MGAHRGLIAFSPHYLCVALAEPGSGVNPQVVPTMDPCGLKFQVIRTNGSRVIAVGSWAEKIGNLQFPVRLTDSLLIYFIRSQVLYLTWSDIIAGNSVAAAYIAIGAAAAYIAIGAAKNLQIWLMVSSRLHLVLMGSG